MAEKLYWYPWHLDRWFGSTARQNMNMEQRGVYRETLDCLYNNGGRIPSDPEDLIRRLGCTAAEFERSFPKTLRELRPDYENPGYLTHNAVLKVLAKQSAALKAQKVKSLKGVQSRKANRATPGSTPGSTPGKQKLETRD